MLFEHSQSGSLLEKFAGCRKDSLFSRIVLEDAHQMIDNGLIELDKWRKIADGEKFFEDDWVFLSKFNQFECGRVVREVGEVIVSGIYLDNWF